MSSYVLCPRHGMKTEPRLSIPNPAFCNLRPATAPSSTLQSQPLNRNSQWFNDCNIYLYIHAWWQIENKWFWFFDQGSRELNRELFKSLIWHGSINNTWKIMSVDWKLFYTVCLPYAFVQFCTIFFYLRNLWQQSILVWTLKGSQECLFWPKAKLFSNNWEHVKIR